MCKAKRSRCDKGYVRVSDATADFNRISDYACEACPTECPLNQITVLAPNKSDSTCDGKFGPKRRGPTDS
jgi:hypothetical protein